MDELLELIFETEDIFKKVMLVGHNPSLTELINYLSPVRIDNLPTCGIYSISFDTKKWNKIASVDAEFGFFESPKKLKQ